MTTGRAGSTALMDELSRFDDICVPNKQISCRDNEILHPAKVKQYAALYQQISGLQVNNDISLIRAFFKSNAHWDYAGFKSMPTRHPNFKQLINNQQIQFITLQRSDLVSTVASFIIAIDADTWRREGGRQNKRFTFGPDYEQRALRHLQYIMHSAQLLNNIPHTSAI